MANLGDGDDSLTIDAASPNIGQITIDGESGANATSISNLGIAGNLSVTQVTTTLSGNVTTGGTQTYDMDVALAQDVVLEGTVVSFRGRLDGSAAGLQSLTIDGNFEFGNSVGDYAGSDVPLEFLSVSGNSIFNAGGPIPPWQNPVNRFDVSNDGVVAVTDLAILAGELATNGPGVLPQPAGNFGPPPYLDVNGDLSLTQEDADEVQQVLNTGGSGESRIPTVTTTGNQTFVGNVILQQDTFLSGDTITFLANLDGTTAGAESLDLFADLVFGDSAGDYIGGNVELASLIVSGNTTLAALPLAKPTVTTTGVQRYDQDVTFREDSWLKGESIIAGGAADGVAAGMQSFRVSGNLFSSASIGVDIPLELLEVSGRTTLGGIAAGVTTAGDQTFGDQITLQNDTTLEAANVMTSGPIETNGSTLTVDVSGTTSTLDGVVAGTGGLFKSGAGTVSLAAVNTYTGPTNVDAGTLLLQGETATGSVVTIASGASLGGTGVARDTVDLSGLLATGTSPGVLTIGNITFQSHSYFVVEIGGAAPGNGSSNHDQLITMGMVTIASNVSLNMVQLGGFTPAEGQRYVIIDNDGSEAVNGTFDGLPEGATIPDFLGSDLDATISYAAGDGNDVVVSTPGTSAIVVSLDGANLKVQAADGIAAELTLAADQTSIIISDPNNPLSTDISGASGDGTNQVAVPLDSFTGAIVVETQSANDTLILDTSITPQMATALVFLGGPGEDELQLAGAGLVLDVSQLPSVEEINIVGTGGNTLNIDSSTAETTVKSEAGDTVLFEDGWSLTRTEIIEGTFYRVIERQGATILLNGPRNWQHPLNPADANNNQIFVEPIGDILRLINEVNTPKLIDKDGALPEPPSAPIETFYDVNGDGFLSAVGDILRQINLANSEAEGESASGDGVGAPVPILAPLSASGSTSVRLSDRDDDTALEKEIIAALKDISPGKDSTGFSMEQLQRDDLDRLFERFDDLEQALELAFLSRTLLVPI